MHYLKNSNRQTMAPRASSAFLSLVMWTTHPMSFLSGDHWAQGAPHPKPFPSKASLHPCCPPGQGGKGAGPTAPRRKAPGTSLNRAGSICRLATRRPSGGGSGRERGEKGPRAFQRQDLARARGRWASSAHN